MRTEHFRKRNKKAAPSSAKSGWTEAIGTRNPQPTTTVARTEPVEKHKDEIGSPVMTYRARHGDPSFDERDPSFSENDDRESSSGSEHDSDFLDDGDNDDQEHDGSDPEEEEEEQEDEEEDDDTRSPLKKEKKREPGKKSAVSAQRLAQLEAEFDPLDFHDQLRTLRQAPWQKWYENVKATVEDFFTELTLTLQKSSHLGPAKSRNASSAIFTPEVTRTMQMALHMDYRPFVENWCAEYQAVLDDWNSAVDQLNAAFPFAKRLACPPGFSTRMLNTCDDLLHCARRFHRLRDGMLEYADGCGWTCHRGLARIFQGRTRRPGGGGDWTKHIARLRTVCARFALICDRHYKPELLGDMRSVLDARPTHRTELSLAKRETDPHRHHPLRPMSQAPTDRRPLRHRRSSISSSSFSSSSSSSTATFSSGSNDALFFLSPRRPHRRPGHHRHHHHRPGHPHRRRHPADGQEKRTKGRSQSESDHDGEKDIERKLRTFVPRAPRPMRLDHLKDV